MLSRRQILFALAVPFALSCGAAKAYHRSSEDLGKATKLFNDYVRWGYGDKASDFVETTKRADFVDWRTKLEKNVRLSDVHVGASEFPKDSKEATVLVTWTFYRNDQLTEQTKTVTEHWFLKDFRWFIRYEPKELPE